MQETNFKIEKDRQEKVEWRRKIEMIKTKLQQMIDALDEAPELGEDPEFDEFVKVWILKEVPLEKCNSE